jgi:hypothetical protein
MVDGLLRPAPGRQAAQVCEALLGHDVSVVLCVVHVANPVQLDRP